MRNFKEENNMKLVGNKNKGYKLVSSFEKETPKKPDDPKDKKPDAGAKGDN